MEYTAIKLYGQRAGILPAGGRTQKRGERKRQARKPRFLYRRNKTRKQLEIGEEESFCVLR